MQSLKLVRFAVLVAVFVFQVEGSPADGTNEAGGDENGTSSAKSETTTKVSDGSKGTFIDPKGSVKGFGPGIEYTVPQLAEVLSAVNGDSLSYSLGLNHFEDIASTLTQLILGQSRFPENGIINYETAILFSEKLTIGTPHFGKALKTIFYVMMKIKQQEDEKHVDLKPLLTEALGFFYGADEVNLQSVEKWLANLDPVIYEVMKGGADAAKKIVNFLESENIDLQGLKRTTRKVQLKTVQAAVENVASIARLLKLKADNIV